MAQKTLIMGESGTGKSTSLRNLDPAITAIVNPVGKPLPFKTDKGKFTQLLNETKSSNIVSWMRCQAKNGKKIIVVDDFQYLLSIPYMNRIHESGWDKWNDFGDDYFRLIDVCAELPEDVRVYYLTHTETLDNGVTTIKLIGKLLREKITIEGLFTIVLRTSVIDQKYYFLTQNSGKDTVKSPMGMFPDYAVDNDLAYVDDKICNYYEIGNYKSDAEMAAADQAVAGDVQKPDKNGRRARGTTPPRKSREQVEKENLAAAEAYQEQVDKALDAAFPGKEEVPFDDYLKVAETVPQPAYTKPPRRTRAERQAQQAAAPAPSPADGFRDIPDTGDDDDLPFTVGGEGGKDEPQPQAMAHGMAADAMNPPEGPERTPRERRQRNIQPQGAPQAGTFTPSGGAADDSIVDPSTGQPYDAAAGRVRRTRRTR